LPKDSVNFEDFFFQKPDEWIEPLKDKQAKQNKDKKVVFTARFSRANCKATWTFKRDVKFEGKKFLF